MTEWAPHRAGNGDTVHLAHRGGPVAAVHDSCNGRGLCGIIGQYEPCAAPPAEDWYCALCVDRAHSEGIAVPVDNRQAVVVDD